MASAELLIDRRTSRRSPAKRASVDPRDRVLRRADEIVLVDVTMEELRERLRAAGLSDAQIEAQVLTFFEQGGEVDEESTG